ncbi:MAG TPA: aldo/keto reductase [Gemmatimonadaceae bacterium]|nr:aldo/keto reductase [Gemmatimonadaceae bacterium]
MIQRTIPTSGEAMPVIGLGTWQTFDVGGSREARAPLAACVSELIGSGARLIDSSPMYGRAEQVVGDVVTTLGVRERAFIATKVWTSGKRRGIEQMTESMQKLNVRVVDLMQVHNLVDVTAHLETLREWKADGRVRYVGVTHYTAHAHAAVARVLETEPIDFVQINYSVGEREAERRILPLAAERGIAVIANRPFGEGALLGAATRRQLPAFAGEIDCTSWPQLLLKFVASHPAVTCVIPATSNPAHLRDNLRAGEGRMPDDSMRDAIAASARGG